MKTFSILLISLSDHFCLFEVVVPVEEGPALEVSQFSTCLDFSTTGVSSDLVVAGFSVYFGVNLYAFDFFCFNQFGISLHCFSNTFDSHCGIGPDCVTEFLLDVFLLVICLWSLT